MDARNQKRMRTLLAMGLMTDAVRCAIEERDIEKLQMFAHNIGGVEDLIDETIIEIEGNAVEAG